MSLNVCFLNTGKLPPALRRKTPLMAKAIGKALGTKGKGELSVIFMSDKEIRALNKESLRHDYITDVISFNYDAPLLGDIAICVPQAKRQAKELGHDLLKELLTLCVHGALHLIGHDDHKPAAKKRMFAAQDRIVSSLLDG